ncbi:hypothetical protein EYF80_043401 [Liparis tanakae]|uniref:Uncharacterized protein n=1 Tax=Liparis tanakae TaxID=230148 RepID=A0A4Z2G1K4_9TELE|nr:hypothetical protein EYF80_043401 [Liparis tanakae]
MSALEDASIERDFRRPKPVTQLGTPEWKVLPSEAKQTGCMKSVNSTGADSFSRQMSFSKHMTGGDGEGVGITGGLEQGISEESTPGDVWVTKPGALVPVMPATQSSYSDTRV